MTTVALVGPDGAGKSTVSRLLETMPVGRPVKRLYMGVNRDASTLMLPTTRLALAVKSAGGRRPDLTMAASPATGQRGLVRAARRTLREAARLGLWTTEEWFRQAVAFWWTRRGAVVVFDRHFVADYAGSGAGRSWSQRVHEFLLERTYPKPDLVVCLDAPGTLLHARKSEASPEWLEQRRAHYLAMCSQPPNGTRFAVVDASQPLDRVAAEVAALIGELEQGR